MKNSYATGCFSSNFSLILHRLSPLPYYSIAYNAEDPIGMFLVILLPGSLLGLLLAGLVVWVMRAFSPDLSDDSSNEERNDGQ